MKYWLVGMVNVLILVFSVGCSDPVQQSRSGTNTLEVDNIASVGTANIRFSITPARPQPESPITIRLSLPPAWLPQPSQLVSISMYMGSLPVVWQVNEEGVWQTTVAVGACVELEMEWQLRVPLTTPQGDELLFFPVVTYRES